LAVLSVFVIWSRQFLPIPFQCTSNPIPDIALTEMLTNSIEQRPSWEANSFSASQAIPAFYRTRMFITAFTRDRDLSLSWASSIHSMPSIPRLEDPF
jgi:hypothetical protein